MIHKIQEVEKIAGSSKFKKLLLLRSKYLEALFYSKVVYRITKRHKKIESLTFFNKPIKVLLPSGMDIYLSGGKTHDSELRLAKYLIINLKLNSCFIDVGAHFGYFTLLASELVGESGEVFSFEPSGIFSLLKENAGNSTNIKLFKQAVSNENSELSFYEFPTLYSEYNTLSVDQFQNEKWIQKNKPAQITVHSTTLDAFIEEQKILPSMIKIDVEGAELNVITGAFKTLQHSSPILIMEFIHHKRVGDNYINANQLMLNNGYQSHLILNDGTLKPVSEVDEYLNKNNLESENIVYLKISG